MALWAVAVQMGVVRWVCHGQAFGLRSRAKLLVSGHQDQGYTGLREHSTGCQTCGQLHRIISLEWVPKCEVGSFMQHWGRNTDNPVAA